MCLTVVTKVNPHPRKRRAWKIFQKQSGITGRAITSLFQEISYPLNKRVERDEEETPSIGNALYHGIHVYLNKRDAYREARNWNSSYIAELAVNPADFLAYDGANVAAYKAATRVSDYEAVPFIHD